MREGKRVIQKGTNDERKLLKVLENSVSIM